MLGKDQYVNHLGNKTHLERKAIFEKTKEHCLIGEERETAVRNSRLTCTITVGRGVSLTVQGKCLLPELPHLVDAMVARACS